MTIDDDSKRLVCLMKRLCCKADPCRGHECDVYFRFHIYAPAAAAASWQDNHHFLSSGLMFSAAHLIAGHVGNARRWHKDLKGLPRFLNAS